jgi:hypothetical protein
MDGLKKVEGIECELSRGLYLRWLQEVEKGPRVMREWRIVIWHSDVGELSKLLS